MNDEERLKEAIDLATEAHKGQLRKYTDTPYIEHPLEVLSILERYYPECTIEQKQAAVLHGTVKYTDMTFDNIFKKFGEKVVIYVYWLTGVSTSIDRCKVDIKLVNRKHRSKEPPEVQIIRVAIILSECKSILEYHKGNSVIGGIFESHLKECYYTLLVMDESLYKEPLYVNTMNLLEDTLEKI